MSIFKETFRDFVFEQLRLREAIIKQGNNSTNRFGNNSTKIKLQNDKEQNINIPPGAFFNNTVNKQCVIRMSSGVNLNKENKVLEEGIYESGEDLTDEGLAIRYILEGGIPINDKGNLSPRGKLSKGYKNFGKTLGSSYGDPFIRSDAKDGYGIVPMPGITDANIRTKTAYGSLREAQINFKCHTRRQLEILELLYMRPGFPILLEWGWSPYTTIEKDKSGKVISAKQESYFPYMAEWFERGQDIDVINSLIVKNKKNSGGNYDGFVGFCKNFSFKSRSDGGYDCTTELIAMGEVLEGIKGRRSGKTLVDDSNPDKYLPVDNMEFYLQALIEYCSIVDLAEGTIENRLSIEDTEDKEEDTTKSTNVFANWDQLANDLSKLGGVIMSKEELDKHIETSTFEETKNKLFNYLQIIADNEQATRDQMYYVTSKIDDLGDYKNKKEHIQKNVKELEEVIDHFIIRKGEDLLNLPGGVTMGVSAVSHFDYIRWDFLVMIMNNFVFDRYHDIDDNPKTICKLTVFRDPISKNRKSWKDEYLEYSKFEFSDKENKDMKVPVWFGSYNKGFSYNTGLNRDNDVQQSYVNPQDLVDQSFNPSICLLPHQMKNPKNGYGMLDKERKIGNIHFNLQHLLDVYRSQRYDDEGGLNDDFSLLDLNTSSPPLQPKDLFEFKIQSNESIVRDFFYNSTIPSSLSATIAIAAQSPSSATDVDSVTFSAFNKDIYYRFLVDDVATSETNDQKYKNAKHNELKKQIESFRKNVQSLYMYQFDMLKLDIDYYDDIGSGALTKETAVNFAKRIESQMISINSKYPLSHPKAGFKKPSQKARKCSVIPLKFNAKLDGISGIVIGNIFRIDKTRLPVGYQSDDIAFAVTGETQNITSGQDWTTDIQGQLLLLDISELEGEATSENNNGSSSELDDLNQDENIVDNHKKIPIEKLSTNTAGGTYATSYQVANKSFALELPLAGSVEEYVHLQFAQSMINESNKNTIQEVKDIIDQTILTYGNNDNTEEITTSIDRVSQSNYRGYPIELVTQTSSDPNLPQIKSYEIVRYGIDETEEQKYVYEEIDGMSYSYNGALGINDLWEDIDTASVDWELDTGLSSTTN